MTVEEGRRLRDAGMAKTASANQKAHAHAIRWIQSWAQAFPTVCSNDLRRVFDGATIPGPVRGSAWSHAVRRGYITPIGYVQSTDPGTHAHPVRLYRSLLYRGEAA